MEAGHPEGYHIPLPRRSHVPLVQKTGDRDEAVKSGMQGRELYAGTLEQLGLNQMVD